MSIAINKQHNTMQKPVPSATLWRSSQAVHVDDDDDDAGDIVSWFQTGVSLPTKPRATTVITAAGGWLLALDLWNELEKSQRHLVFAGRSEAKEVVMVNESEHL